VQQREEERQREAERQRGVERQRGARHTARRGAAARSRAAARSGAAARRGAAARSGEAARSGAAAWRGAAANVGTAAPQPAVIQQPPRRKPLAPKTAKPASAITGDRYRVNEPKTTLLTRASRYVSRGTLILWNAVSSPPAQPSGELKAGARGAKRETAHA